MKRIFSLFLAIIVASNFFAVYASAVGITIDNTAVSFSDAAPFVDQNDRTLVPLRAVADAMGIAVTWNAEKRYVTFSKTWTEETTPIRKDRDGDGTAESYPLYREVVFYIDSKQYEVTIDKWYSYDKQSGQMQEHISGGWVMEMDTAAIIRNNRTYAPIRYLAECFYYDVIWDSSAQQVHILPYEPYSYDCQYTLSDTLSVTVQNTGNLVSAQITSIGLSADDTKLAETPFLPTHRRTACTGTGKDPRPACRRFGRHYARSGDYLSRHHPFFRRQIQRRSCTGGIPLSLSGIVQFSRLQPGG